MDDTWQALQAIAATVRDRARARRILVTGTEGKTGFTSQFRHLASGQIEVAARPDSNNMDHGICTALANIKRDDAVAVLEVAVPYRHRGMRRAQLVQPELCVITEIGYEHLAKHGSVDELIKAKASVASALVEDGRCLIQSNPRYFEKLRKRIRRYGEFPIFTFGTDHADFGRLLAAHFDGLRRGWEVEAVVGGQSISYFLPRVEQHAPLSSVAVLAAMRLIDLDLEVALERFHSLDLFETAGRMQELSARSGGTYTLYDQSHRNYLLALDDFFQTASRLTPRLGGRKILVLGHIYDEREYGNLIWEMLPPLRLRQMIDTCGLDSIYTIGH